MDQLPIEDELTGQCKLSIDVLRKGGINMLAIDFDQTLITEHTYGQWKGSSKELSTKVRPLFQRLVPIALSSGLLVSIVTFSGQTVIIKEVLGLVYGVENSKKIIVRARDNTWGTMGTAKEGKMYFMSSAAAAGQELFGVSVTRDTTVLIDDDVRNIKIALKGGVRAVHFLPDTPNQFFVDVSRFVTNESQPLSLTPP